MYRAVFVVFTVLLLSSCVGLAVGTFGKKEWARADFRLGKERNQFVFEKKNEPYKEEEIIEYWGRPDSVDTFKECKILIYKGGTSWAGGGAFVGIVPVPLLVPTGTYKNRFYLQNNSAIGLVQEYGEVDRAVGYTCGSNECITSSGEKVNEPEINAQEAIEQWCATSL
ncbi:hypothetical protein [Microbulbifer sp. THAF38]|uniref:hypothetical protein n=1 Tax=Microbulbifer sp. THAF38 TaxID=2587856 RepID=UPI0012688EBD|nr:hypothetical protein [Microbulbifer sp. THAF38]QFT54447.1 hypothetical protein FIU95_07760 [Microbulbifer sp. THAF38]